MATLFNDHETYRMNKFCVQWFGNDCLNSSIQSLIKFRQWKELSLLCWNIFEHENVDIFCSSKICFFFDFDTHFSLHFHSKQKYIFLYVLSEFLMNSTKMFASISQSSKDISPVSAILKLLPHYNSAATPMCFFDSLKIKAERLSFEIRIRQIKIR